MRFPIWITIIGALIGFGLMLLIGQAIIQPDQPLILSAGFDDSRITPDADGDADITIFRYELTGNAAVTLTLESEAGRVFTFRNEERRIAGEYSVPFSGVVNGYLESGEEIPGLIERRLMPNGLYTWRLTAQQMNSDMVEEQSGNLEIANADAPLPVISNFTVSPQIFSPNQDGIDDRVAINIFLEEAADLRVVLVADETGREIPISARRECRLPGEAGRHCFDYEGGVDLGADPPQDGTYRVLAYAQDAVGQRLRMESSLTIVDGGKPRAEISPQAVGVDVVFGSMPYDEDYFTDMNGEGALVDAPDNPELLTGNQVIVPVGDMLVFRLTVDNYGPTPIRTSGPQPGTVYQQDQLAAAMGQIDQAGVWRVGIQCTTSTVSFPYRWAVAAPEDLVTELSPISGEAFTYLPAGARSVVWGAIRLTDLNERANPQQCWAGLIHEGVEIAELNRFVGSRDILIVDPSVNPSQ